MACRIGNVRALLLAAVALLPLTTNAHEMRPGYLEIRETAVDTYEVLWKVPAQGDNRRMSIYLRFDDDVSLITEPVAAFVGNTHIQRMKIERDGGLTGSTVVIDGLAASLTDVLMRLERIDGTDITHRMTPDDPSYVFEADPSAWQVAWTYMALGVEHILSGVDHLLFVLALLMVVVGWRRLVGTVTAFTVAHSITLALAALGFVRAPGPPVEAIIALSIVFVAAEIIRGRQGHPGLTARLPWIVAFSFGLLHGFGFAGALSEIGLPQSSIPLALFTFNVGVEIGQLMFIAAILLLYGLGKRFRPVPPEWAWRIPSYAIGGIAAFWVFERIAGFWT
ncbi:MAG: HupE/UreJ family protein [Gammaproteobacteria bacterium]|nr:HupE/UreJ family protein [Gammaproteobacteria bacterium]